MTINKNTIISFIIGMVVMATAYLGYVFYHEIGLIGQDHATLVQIVDLINKNTQQAQPAQAPTETPKK